MQVGIPTDAHDSEAWPSQTHALDGKLGPDYFLNGEISTRLSLERSMNKLTETPNRRSWGESTPLEVSLSLTLTLALTLTLILTL